MLFFKIFHSHITARPARAVFSYLIGLKQANLTPRSSRLRKKQRLRELTVEGSGSSVTFEKDGKRAYFHRPYPQREALIYRVKAAREFLLKLEIAP